MKKYWEDETEMKMEQYRAIVQTHNLGEPLNRDDAVALLEISAMFLNKLADAETKLHHIRHKNIHGVDYPHTKEG